MTNANYLKSFNYSLKIIIISYTALNMYIIS